MASVEQYAQWLVDNDDKKGTEDHAQVLQAFNKLKEPRRRDYGIGETFTRGVSRGASRLGSTFTDVLPAMGASALGFDEYAEAQLAEAAEKERRLAVTNPAQFQSYKDVEGIGDAIKFGLETVGEQVPNLATAIVPGIGGGSLAARGAATAATKAATAATREAAEGAAKKAAATLAKPRAKPLSPAAVKAVEAAVPQASARIYSTKTARETAKAAAKAAAAAAPKGQLAGAFLGSYALNAPEVFRNIYEETGETAPGVAALFSSVSAGLDSILPAALMQQFSGPLKGAVVKKLLTRSGMRTSTLSDGLLKPIGLGLAAGIGTEGLTEGAQEAISIAAEQFVNENEDYWDSEDWERIMEASVRGAVAGGAFGGVGGVPRGMRNRAATKAEEQRVVAEQEAEQAATVAAQQEAEQQAELTATASQDPQGDLFGTPIASALLPVQEAETDITKFTKAELRQEAQRRTVENKTKFPKEFEKIKQEVAAAKKAATKAAREAKQADKKLAAAQQPMFTEEGAPTAPIEKQYQAGLKAQEKQDAQRREQRRKQLLDAKQENLSFERSPEELVAEQANRDAAVRKEAEQIVSIDYENQPRPENFEELVQKEIDVINERSFETQGDIFAGMPGELTRAPAVGRELNTFINNQELPSTSVIKEIYAGKDLAIPEQRQEVIDGLNNALTTRNYNSTNTEKIVSAIEKLDGSPAQTTEVITSDQVTETDQQGIDEFVADTTTETEQDLGQPVESYRGTLQGQEQTTFNVYKTPDGFVTEITRPNVLKGQPPAVSRTQHKTKKQVETAKKEIIDTMGVLKKAPANKLANKPTYQGKAFNREQRRIAERGNFRQLLNSLINTQPQEIQQVLRKIRSQNLATKLVVGATGENISGYYDAGTDTIVLSPEDGLFSGFTEQTFLHEASHAALAQALNDPDLQITKDFFKFYSDIKDQMGDAYGGQDLQEFAAELIGNPEFQALLKDTRAPKAPSWKNMFFDIMESIARFFGFRPGQSAYTKGLDFIDKILDVSQGVEPTLSDRLFLGTPTVAVKAIGDMFNAAPPFAKKVDAIKNTISNLQDRGLKRIALGTLRIDHLAKLYGVQLPGLKLLGDSILARQAKIENDIKSVIGNYREFEKTNKRVPGDVEKLWDIAEEARRKGFDLLGIDKDPVTGKLLFDKNKLTPAELREFQALDRRYKNLDTDVQNMYRKMREDYLKSFNAYGELILSQVTNPGVKQNLIEEFRRKVSKVGYVPLVRFGDYYLSFEDPTGEHFTYSFESDRERKLFIAANKARLTNPRPFTRSQLSNDGTDFPSSAFIRKLMDNIPNNPDGTPALAKGEMFDMYLELFPESSVVQRLRKAKETKGASSDMVRVYGDTMVKWTRKLGNMEYLPKIQQEIRNIQQQGKNYTPANDKAPSNSTIDAVVEEILERKDFIESPNYSNLIAKASVGSYSLFILGNISSAIINLTAVPLLVAPMLWGQYVNSGTISFNDINKAILSASKLAVPWGKESWTEKAKYKNLAAKLMEFAQLEHTMQREILEGSRQKTEDYNSQYAKIMNLVSVPFAAAETYSRATAAIATYDLAISAGKTEEVAVREALDLVRDTHTSGMAAEGPRYLQNSFAGGLGRVMFTFKTFIWNSAFVTARAMQQSLKGESDQVKSMARRQVVGIFGMSAAIGGINGLPFYGAAATLANMINALLGDDEEAFNFKAETRLFTNEFIYKGPLNYLTNLEISNRAGIANGLLFREDPYSIEENGYLMTAVMQALGPLGSYALNIERNFGKQMEAGNYGRAFETLSPSMVRNVLKGGRYVMEGARTTNGEPIDTDINGYNLFLQFFGFSPADVTSLYEVRSDALNFQTKIRGIKRRLIDRWYSAYTAGDYKTADKAKKELDELGFKFPGLVNKDTLSRSYKTRESQRKDLIAGVKFDNAVRPIVTERFLEEFPIL